MSKKKYTCEQCGKIKTENDGSFTDEDMKKFCCQECCGGDVKKEDPIVCEFC